MPSQLVSRAGWGAAPWDCRTLYTGYVGITVHYPGPTPWTTSKSVEGRGIDRSSAAAFAASCDHDFCAGIVRAYQAFHMGPDRGGCDIFYSSLICPHAVRFDGRGPGVKSGAQGTVAGNNQSVGIQYIGGTTPAGVLDPFPDGCKLAYYDEAARFDRPLRWGHRDWKSTSCPGDLVYAWRAAGFPRPPEEDDVQADERIWLKTVYDHIHTHKGAVQAQTVWSTIAPPSNSTALGALGEIFFNVRDIKAALANVAPDVDEQAIAQAILAGLNPAQIGQAVVAAIGPELAQDVVAALAAELAD